MERGDVVHHLRGRSLQLDIPTARAAPIRRMPSRRPSPAPLQQPLNPATGGLSGPSTSSCRSRSLNRTPKHSAGRREMLHDPPPDKRPREVRSKYLGRIVRTRRNPASQTIIRRLSQCSSTAQSDAAAAILPRSTFSREISRNRHICRRPALDRRIARCRHRWRVPQEPDSRRRRGLRDCLQGAVIAVSVQCSDRHCR